MASPFRIFRKYMKTLLVVFGVMIMFVFVIGDALVGYLGGSRGGSVDGIRDAGAVAVRWDGGSLTNAQLEDLKARRRITNAFQEQVHGLGAEAASMAGVEPRNLRVQPLVGPETPQQGVERSVVQTKLFADAARQAGMHVSDEVIVRYLDELGRGNVSRDEMRAIVERHQASGWRVSIDFVIDALREEMLARNYMMSHLYAFRTVTPQQRWKDWLSVNDRVVIEAAAIPAESFVIDVPEPTEAELVAFFDEYKNRESQPDLVGQMELPSPTPGFRLPRKIDLQFVQASFDDFMTKVEAEITDEEIAKYYEDNKELFIKADTGLIDDTSETDDTTPSDEAEEQEATSDETEGTEPGAATDESSDADPASESESATESETPLDAGGPEEEPQPPVDDGGEEATPADGDQSSLDAATNKRVFRPAAFLQEADAEATVEDTADGEPPITAESTAEATGETEAPVEQVDPSVKADSTAEESKPADGPIDQPATAAPANDTPASDKPKEYQPLEEVSDLIRRDLAQRRVVDQLTDLMHQLMGELNAEFQTYFNKVLDAQSQNRKPPAPPTMLADLAPLAEKHGLSHAKTGPMPWLELRNTPVGKSGNPDTRLSLSTTLFADRDLDLYEAILTVDIDGNHYISMKVSDTPGRVPKLAEVRDEVVRAWKLREASKLALKDAEEQAKKAEEAGSPLTDFFADKQSIEVVRTDPFSQLTRGDVPDQFGRPRFRLGQPDGIVAPGTDFLRRVFELKVGEVGAVLNHDKSIAYVVRVVEHQNSQDELRAAYLTEANNWDGLAMMTNEHAQLAQQLLAQDIVESAEMKWERPSDTVEREDED